VADLHGRQIVFCGDAAHAGATLWQPYHLEWDHWTGSGALAAWEGVQRLANLGMDLLCPAHGPVITHQPRRLLDRLGRKLMAFYHAKGHICAGERDRYFPLRQMSTGAWQVLPSLFQFGKNGYLLLSKTHEAMVVDPSLEDMPALAELLGELNQPRLRVGVSTHYHCDHSDALPYVKRTYGAVIWLHPRVAIPLADDDLLRFPWLPSPRVTPDRLWPERGRWTWNEYVFEVAPFGGQTWWHCAFLTTVNGQRVLFSGDNFQPPSRWNGTGGFSSLNGSRFREGFIRSAQQVIDWQPDLIAAGHVTIYRYHPRQFRKIIQWSHRAERATRALCPSGRLRQDYYLHRH
jgi:glyoxylase-like metal-dependent hydrolase (beta-lactamase superfamily II)